MRALFYPGRILLAIAVAGFGIECVATGDFLPGLQPLQRSVWGYSSLARINAVILFGLGVALLVPKARRPAAIALGIFLLAWALIYHLPTIVLAPASGNRWTAAFELVAIAGAASVVAVGISGDVSYGLLSQFRDSARAAGRICYGVSLPVFGVLHFFFSGYIASVIPAWMPWHLFWAYFIGAAGLSIMTGMMARLAAILTGLMFLLWVVIVHAPRVAARPGNRNEWTSLLVAMAMAAGAWLLAGRFACEGEDSSGFESGFCSGNL